MNKGAKIRYFQLIGLVLLLAVILIVRLFVLSVIQTPKWAAAAEELSTKTIYTTAPRGQILDRNGKVLAGNVYTISVSMSKGSMTDEMLNQSILKVARVLEENGDQLLDSFPMTVKKNGKIFFNHNGSKKELLNRYGFSQDLNAKQAFSKLRNYFTIDEELTAEDARRVMIVRNEMAALGYKKYMPVTIAKDISQRSVAILEENSQEYPGAEVFSEVSRNYPKGSFASHILGYLGKISDSEREEYVNQQGYQSWDMVGKDGIEKAYESVLRGKAGEKKVQVNAAGNLVKTISQREPEQGKDVTLTIDMKLQETAEEALEQGLEAMRRGGTFASEFGDYSMKQAPKAEVGAVVALEVKTGDVLAMASYPDFDPNLFANGISTKDWKSLQSKNPRNPLAPAPLYNVATKSAVQPGSTFKMVTAITALQCGLDPNKRLYDDGYVKLGNRSFGCVAWNLSRKKHGLLNLQEALEVSCNYYFYDLATGKDLYTGSGLGYEENMSIDKIMDYAAQFGLGQSTGIEIPETVTGTPSKETKIASLRGSLKNVLLAETETYFKRDAIQDKAGIQNSIETITNWIGQDLSVKELEDRLAKMTGIKQEKASQLAELCKYTYMNQATWNTADALNIAIGQGENSYTPLQMARYTAALGNKGVRNPISLVEKIEGRGKIEKDAPFSVEVKDESFFDEIIGGMTRVANGSGGSLTRMFQNFPVTVAGKTGTAQRAGKINPPDEEEYIREHLSGIAPSLSWEEIQEEKDRLMKEYPDIYASRHTAVRRAVMNLSEGKVTASDIDRYKESYDNFAWVVTMAPAEEPQIAVAVMITQGDTAANAGPIAREVIGAWLQQEKNNN